MFDSNDICAYEKKSIYEELKEFYSENPGCPYSYQDFEIGGVREFKVIYNKINPLKINQKVKLANELINLIFDYVKEEKKEIFENIKGYMVLNPISDYYEEFVKSFKAFVETFKEYKEGLTDFLKELIYNGRTHDEIKLAIMMLSVIKLEKMEQLLKVFSIDNEYIFYVIKAYETMDGSNNKIFNLAIKSIGYGKAICIHELQPVSDKIIEWLILDGLEENFGYLDSLEYTMLSVNLLKFLKSGRINKDNIKRLSKSFGELFSEYTINNIDNGFKVCFEYFKLVDKYGDDIYSLYGVISGIYSIDTFIFEEYGADGVDRITSLVPQYEKISNFADEIYKKNIWKDIIFKELSNIDLEIEILIDAIEKTEFKISNKEFIVLIERDYENPALYRYGLEKGNKELKESIYNIAYDKLPIAKILNRNKEIIDLDDLVIKPMYHLCFYFLVKGIKYNEFPKEYKKINFDALNASLIETRNKSINNLMLIKNEFSDEDKKIIEEQLIEETLKKSLTSLVDNFNNKKKEYLELSKEEIIPHVKDIYIMSTHIADTKYRDLSIIDDNCIEDEMLYLIREKDSKYDENAINIVTSKGYVLGYVPKSDSLILKNMIDNGKYFYGVIEKISENFDRIDIMIYMSYKDVIDEITNTISLLYNKDGKYLQ
ncbi:MULTISPECIES: HIRAN domain-containing protein [Clostridium]|uniref:HIRAN domain-containing protein n=1 Tax=Clostridium TaxID=1485 RepID=UPI0013FBE420|nr:MULTISPECIES: HIRAN domain-containing protein [Clostridium]MBY6916546.1 HIRAN domain-containing protein [Clostridium botulinum]MBY7024936.1 HIRAN domain-containing protein [Clostridium botulinum]NFG26178.1 DNA-binding protein [Clostridium botulinum]NFI54635.1 DNA-binding protein [Clostridium botulinum]NFO39115.1 DNA-binding protein [Clostridium botulinum]